jgi:TonB family protein
MARDAAGGVGGDEEVTGRRWMTRRSAAQVVILASLLTRCGTTEGPVSPAPQERVARAGDPISTDLSDLDPMMRSYLLRVRQTIEGRLTHPPCEWQRRYWLWHCGYRTTHLVLELIIAKDGWLESVIVREPSEFVAYNDSATNTVWAAAPFPPISDALLGGRKAIRVRLPVDYRPRP